MHVCIKFYEQEEECLRRNIEKEALVCMHKLSPGLSIGVGCT